ncbi:carbonic anhydrase, partial [Planococcus sp. SIMBA_143]
PLMVPDVPIHGTVINPANGKVDLVINGYEEE